MAKFIKQSAALLFCVLLSGRVYAFEQTIYIWQKSWDEGVHASIQQLAPQTDRFSVLAATISSSRGKPVISRVNINPAYLHEFGKPVILAVRMLSSCGKLLSVDKVESFASKSAVAIRALVDEATNNGVVVAGVQLDYDSPTSKLQDYGRFLSLVQSDYPGLQISITTLPTWMDSSAFSGLVKPLAFYVLQLHSLETPKTINEKYLLFDLDSSRRYFEQAVSVGQKFYVSLPTYGYETAFDSKGQFVGLRAENKRVRWGDDVQLKIVMADPDKVAGFFQEIKGTSSPLLTGVYWFRLPVKNDELNWGVKTIQVIMSGGVPQMSFKAGSGVSQDGATEVFLENAGEKDFIGTVGFDVLWGPVERPLFDLLGAYSKQDIKGGKGIHITGPAPKVGERRLVGWFRHIKKESGVLEVQTTKVTVYDSKINP